jgi:glycine betaine transporter
MFTNILVAFDFSDPSKAALQCALDIAAKYHSRLHLVHVIADPSSEPWAEEAFALSRGELIAHWQERARRDLTEALPALALANAVIVAPVGSPQAEIIKYAAGHQIDLIVLGTHGRGAIGQWLLGSVAERLVRHAECSVLTVRQGTVEP